MKVPALQLLKAKVASGRFFSVNKGLAQLSNGQPGPDLVDTLHGIAAENVFPIVAARGDVTALIEVQANKRRVAQDSSVG
jgi:hypothetical protein